MVQLSQFSKCTSIKKFIASGPAQDIAVSAMPRVIFEGLNIIQQKEIQ